MGLTKYIPRNDDYENCLLIYAVASITFDDPISFFQSHVCLYQILSFCDKSQTTFTSNHSQTNLIGDFQIFHYVPRGVSIVH